MHQERVGRLMEAAGPEGPARRLDPDLVAQKRKEGNQIAVTLHVGKNGITPGTVDELKGQLKKHKLVKVRLLPASTEGGAQDDEQAQRLAAETGSHLIERRGHTALYWRGRE